MRKPWDRKDGEPNKWYARFQLYLLQGSNRSVLATVNEDLIKSARGKSVKKTKSVPQAFRDATIKWKWKNRAEAYDTEQQQQAMLDQEMLVREQRLLELRLRNKMGENAERMLDWPISDQTVQEDTGVTIVKGAGWDKRTALDYVKTTVSVGRTTAGMGDNADVTVQHKQELTPTEEMKWLKEMARTPDLPDLPEESPESDNGNGSKPH